ncbi:MAG: HdeA/HdeB family chaperone [Bosea sp. (in: a-proteobacteria)]
MHEPDSNVRRFRRASEVLPMVMMLVHAAVFAIGLCMTKPALAQTSAQPQAPTSQPDAAQSAQPQPAPPVTSAPATSAPGRMLDLSNATCAQFMALSRADKDQIVLWLSGFYAGGAQRPRIDVGLLAGASRAMDDLCAKTPTTPLLGQETRPLLFR